jgi:hypothetical protein
MDLKNSVGMTDAEWSLIVRKNALLASQEKTREAQSLKEKQESLRKELQQQVSLNEAQRLKRRQDERNRFEADQQFLTNR